MASAMPWLLGKRDRFLEEPMAQQRECVYIKHNAVLSSRKYVPRARDAVHQIFYARHSVLPDPWRSSL